MSRGQWSSSGESLFRVGVTIHPPGLSESWHGFLLLLGVRMSGPLAMDSRIYASTPPSFILTHLFCKLDFMKVYSCNINCLGSIEASDTYIQVLKHPKLVNRCLSCMSAFVKGGMAQTLGSLSDCLCVRAIVVMCMVAIIKLCVRN